MIRERAEARRVYDEGDEMVTVDDADIRADVYVVDIAASDER